MINKVKEQIKKNNEMLKTISTMLINYDITKNNEENQISREDVEFGKIKLKEIEEFNKEDYKKKKILDIKFTEFNLFNNKKDFIQISKNILKGNNIEKPMYISYMEKNAKFTLLPKENVFKIEQNKIYQLQCNFNEEVFQNIDIYVIYYDHEKKTHLDIINSNKEKLLNIKAETQNIRIAIKIKNNFSLDLEKINIEIFETKKLGNLDFHQLRKLGYDNPKRLNEVKIACIFDEFTTQCFEGEVNLLKISPFDWKGIFTIEKPHILMVESAWQGNQGLWKGKIECKNKEVSSELKELILWCNENEIPTIFWNKEDPVHYEDFIGSVKLFDYVYTTNLECVEIYKKDTGKNNVFVLPFAAQPNIHNPIELLSGRKEKICFAGSYYRNKYEHRGIDTRRLLDISMPYGIDIYDRNFNKGIEHYRFPEKYEKYVRGSLKGEEIILANKGYKVVLNLNTVKDSKTMFARRVFELLASNTPVVSNYSKGINEIFKNIVMASDDKKELEEEMALLMQDKFYYDRKKLIGLRAVYENHLYKHRALTILNKLDFKIKEDIKKILILIDVENQKQYEKIYKLIEKQKYKNFDFVNINTNLKNIKSFNQIEIEDYDYITYFNVNDYYGEYYLKDLILATEYSTADIIGKKSIYEQHKKAIVEINKGYEYDTVDELNENTMLIKRKILTGLNRKQIIDIFKDKNKIQFKLNKYAIDRFNYIKNYNGKDIAKICF